MPTKRIVPKDPVQSTTPAQQAGAEPVKRETLGRASDRHLKENVRAVEWTRQTLVYRSDVHLKEHVLPVEW
jgi:hypothetical protein